MYFDEELEGEESPDPRRHRVILDTEQEAEDLAAYLEEHGFYNVYFSFDDDSNNYDLGFTSDHPLTDAQIDAVLAQVPDHCSYCCNIEDY
jgi:hypothetical protein